MDYIHTHYADDIKLQDISKQFYITPSALSRAFRTSTGKNFLDYLHEVRITEAKKLMDGGCSIKDAAFRVGYLNMNNFYKHFKVCEGVTPAEYNKSKTKMK